MTRSDDELLAQALAHLDVLRNHLQAGDLADQTIADAVSLRLAAAIEAVNDCDAQRLDRLFGDEWTLMWATRNRIAHGYAFVDLAIIQATVEQDVPAFEEKVREEYLRLTGD